MSLQMSSRAQRSIPYHAEEMHYWHESVVIWVVLAACIEQTKSYQFITDAVILNWIIVNSIVVCGRLMGGGSRSCICARIREIA